MLKHDKTKNEEQICIPCFLHYIINVSFYPSELTVLRLWLKWTLGEKHNFLKGGTLLCTAIIFISSLIVRKISPFLIETLKYLWNHRDQRAIQLSLWDVLLLL